MLLAERHQITRTHRLFAEIDAWAKCSKNLYNRANYCLRQKFINEGVYIGYSQINNQLKKEECYQALPAKVSQQILRKLDLNWKSFFQARSSYNQEPSKFQARPGLPKYKLKNMAEICSSTFLDKLTSREKTLVSENLELFLR
jgi:putative transposase